MTTLYWLLGIIAVFGIAFVWLVLANLHIN